MIAGLVDYVIPFLVILTVLVFVHEMGHYLVARRAGVRVEVFSIGFGRELFGWTARSGTRWKFSAIPLGGYVKMFGDADAASTGGAGLDAMSAEDRAVCFHHKSLKARSAIVAAGPIANSLFAILLLAGLYGIVGRPYAPPVVDEVIACITFARDLYRAFGLGEPSRVAVSTRPDKSIGTSEQWEQAERALMDAAAASGFAYEVDAGEGAFYGPKIDIHARDAIGREWQLTTIQVDFNLPGRFGLAYIGEDGQKHEPFMVHRALFGSIERFFAVLLESTNGAFPFWLAPEQVRVVPVAADFLDHAHTVVAACRAVGLRAEVDGSDDSLGARIRAAQTEKVPVTLVVGADEQAQGTVAVRRYGGDQRKGVPLDQLVQELVEESRAGRRGEIAVG